MQSYAWSSHTNKEEDNAAASLQSKADGDKILGKISSASADVFGHLKASHDDAKQVLESVKIHLEMDNEGQELLGEE